MKLNEFMENFDFDHTINPEGASVIGGDLGIVVEVDELCKPGHTYGIKAVRFEDEKVIIELE